MANIKGRQVQVAAPKVCVATDSMDEKTEFGWHAPDGVFRHLLLALDRCKKEGRRVKIQYGSCLTGRPWHEDLWDYGCISTSMGPKKILILVHNRRSMGGASILIQNIVSIGYSNKKYGDVIWAHQLYPHLEWDFQSQYKTHMRFSSIRFYLPRMHRCASPIPYLFHISK